VVVISSGECMSGSSNSDGSCKQKCGEHRQSSTSNYALQYVRLFVLLYESLQHLSHTPITLHRSSELGNEGCKASSPTCLIENGSGSELKRNVGCWMPRDIVRK